jgi:hypothetical protein
MQRDEVGEHDLDNGAKAGEREADSCADYCGFTDWS